MIYEGFSNKLGTTSFTTPPFFFKDNKSLWTISSISPSKMDRPRFFSLMTFSGISFFLLALLIICSYLFLNDRPVVSPMLNFDFNFLQAAALSFPDPCFPISYAPFRCIFYTVFFLFLQQSMQQLMQLDDSSFQYQTLL